MTFITDGYIHRRIANAMDTTTVVSGSAFPIQPLLQIVIINAVLQLAPQRVEVDAVSQPIQQAVVKVEKPLKGAAGRFLSIVATIAKAVTGSTSVAETRTTEGRFRLMSAYRGRQDGVP